MSYLLQSLGALFSMTMFVFLFANTHAAVNSKNPLDILNDLFNNSSIKSEPTSNPSPFPFVDKILKNSFPSAESSQKVSDKLGTQGSTTSKKTEENKTNNLDEALGLNDEMTQTDKDCQIKSDGTCMSDNEIREQKIAEQNQEFIKNFAEKMQQQGQSPQSGGGGGQPPSGGGGGEQGGGKGGEQGGGGGGQAKPEEGGSVAQNFDNLDEECKRQGINKPNECRKIKPTKVSDIKPLQSGQMIQLVHSTNLSGSAQGMLYTEDDKYFSPSPHSNKYLSQKVKYVICPDTGKPGCKVPIKPVFVRADAKSPARPINFVPSTSI